MNLNPATRARIEADMTLGVDPEGSTIEVKVDDTWYSATWLAEATTRAVLVKGVVVTRWFRTARTVGYFCGPDATTTGATVLALGLHTAKTRVTVSGEQLAADADPIEVK